MLPTAATWLASFVDGAGEIIAQKLRQKYLHLRQKALKYFSTSTTKTTTISTKTNGGRTSY